MEASYSQDHDIEYDLENYEELYADAVYNHDLYFIRIHSSSVYISHQFLVDSLLVIAGEKAFMKEAKLIVRELRRRGVDVNYYANQILWQCIEKKRIAA